MHRLQSRYAASQNRLLEQATRAAAEAGIDTASQITREAIVLAQRFDIGRKKRSASEYADIASYLLSNYTPEVAYFVAAELTKQFEPKLGYPPIGQIMVSMENQGGESAARWIACALRNFPRIETAQLAFGVIKSPAMRSLVQAELATHDAEMAEYISSGEVVASPARPTSSVSESTPQTEVKHQTRLSDGIGRMPRRLTEAERKGDRLFLHLQIVSLVLFLLCPVLGAVLGGWPGAVIGLGIGWIVRVWMRRSMGHRGSNPDEGFFIRMRERANGARRGILEAVIEGVRQRPFTQEQCAAITKAWEDTRERIAATESAKEKRELINAFDAEIKRISYGRDD
mgnify:CR=1 FL=1